MTATPSGGTFSGPGVAGNTFQPSVIGVGNWCIKYTYNDPVSGCSSDTTVCVAVDSLPKLTISGYNPSYCHLDSAVTLVGSPSGGTFSGPGISGNIFSPANALSGTNIITYTYTDTLFGCSNSTQFAININNVPTMTIAASDSVVCPGSNVSLSAQYSTDVFNIVWSNINGTSIYSGLNAFTVNPSAANNCYIATAVNNAGCTTRDTLCLQLLDCYINAIDEPCEADSVAMNTPITLQVLAIDTLPSIGTDTTISIQTNPVSGTVVVNSDHTITYTPTADFSGNVSFVYQVCVTIKGYPSCDTADVCITVVDTTVNCNFPNTITPNNDGINDEFAISCNDEYPNSEIRIYDRWGAEVYRMSHYDNKWSGYNQQGIRVPDGTYFYMYYFNNGSNKMKAGFVDVYR
jgi:gliding motility-associated-like protein